MALQLAEKLDKTIPGVVKAIVAKKSGSLQHQAMAKSKNEEQVKLAGSFLRRSHGSN